MSGSPGEQHRWVTHQQCHALHKCQAFPFFPFFFFSPSLPLFQRANIGVRIYKTMETLLSFCIKAKSNSLKHQSGMSHQLRKLQQEVAGMLLHSPTPGTKSQEPEAGASIPPCCRSSAHTNPASRDAEIPSSSYLSPKPRAAYPRRISITTTPEAHDGSSSPW